LQVLTIGQQSHLDVTSTKVNQSNKPNHVSPPALYSLCLTHSYTL